MGEVLSLTQQQILDLAPDTSSRKSGQDLGHARKWATLGTDGRTLWGEIKGSGASPYRASADLTDGTSKCSCPSRKFPCKHGLGLMLSNVASPEAFPKAEPPDWVAKWIQGRDVRAGKAEAPEAKPVDEKARAKRAEAREGKVKAGAAELDLWVRDALRRGLAGIRSEDASFFDRMAARLVDAQAPGLAQAVQRLYEHASGVTWPGFTADETLALATARLGLAARALQDDSLPEDTRHDLREFAGVPYPSDKLAEIEPVTDAWMVGGIVVEPEGKVSKRQVWLVGANTGRTAILVDFGRPLPAGPVPGLDFEGGVCFHPGTSLRSSLRDRGQSVRANPKAMSIPAALDAFAATMAARPWTESVPVHLGEVRVGRFEGKSAISDGTLTMPLAGKRASGFEDASAGQSCSVFGLWNGRVLTPLSMTRGDRRYAAGPDASGNDVARVA